MMRRRSWGKIPNSFHDKEKTQKWDASKFYPIFGRKIWVRKIKESNVNCVPFSEQRKNAASETAKKGKHANDAFLQSFLVNNFGCNPHTTQICQASWVVSRQGT